MNEEQHLAKHLNSFKNALSRKACARNLGGFVPKYLYRGSTSEFSSNGHKIWSTSELVYDGGRSFGSSDFIF